MHSGLDFAMYVWRHCLAITHPTHLVCVACIVSLISRCIIHIYIYYTTYVIHIYIYCLAISLPTSNVLPLAFTSVYSLHATALQCALCTFCFRIHSDFASLACSRLRPCNVLCAPLASVHSDFESLACSRPRPCCVLYAPLASECIASLRRLHAPGYGLAMCFAHLLLLHA